MPVVLQLRKFRHDKTLYLGELPILRVQTKLEDVRETKVVVKKYADIVLGAARHEKTDLGTIYTYNTLEEIKQVVA
jgi:hypothetical protein